jgi:hypothetical protein
LFYFIKLLVWFHALMNLPQISHTILVLVNGIRVAEVMETYYHENDKDTSKFKNPREALKRDY